MDFNKKIDEIIFKYKLDVHYPRYRKRKLAEEYLKVWAKEREEETGNLDKILCLSADEWTISHVSFFTENKKKFEYLCVPTVPLVDTEGLKEISWNDYSQIWIVSLKGEISIGAWLRDNKISYYSLYDDFSAHGIELEDEFYKYYSKNFDGCEKYKEYLGDEDAGNVFLEWHYQYMMSKETNDENLKKFYLRKLFFLAVVQRNFVLAEKYKQQLQAFEDVAEIYDKAWNDLKNLIDELAARMAAREQDDILMCWLDQLVYESEKEMPFVRQEMNDGIYFENAFTLFCNTYPTFRYLFTDVKENTIDLFSHKHVLDGNASKVCDMLKDYGYGFKVISEEFNHTNLKREYCCDTYMDHWLPISIILWNAFVSLLNSQGPCLIVMHELIQTHGPIAVSEMSYEMFDKKNVFELREKKALVEVDEQIRFYMSMLHKNAIRIYMSDHGRGDEVCRQMHCMFAVKGKNYEPQRVEEMFSYKDFPRLIKQMLDKKIHTEDITCDYAEVYGYPMYSKIHIGGRIKRGEIEATELGFRGCVTKDNLYLRMKDDRELLLDRKKMPVKEYLLSGPNDICNRDLLPYFRSRVGDLIIDWEAEKWKYTKYYNKVYDNWKRCGRNQIRELNQYIVSSGCSKIGIRMGGKHSAVLYEWLDKVNQDRVVCFIDSNEKCECAKFGKDIVGVGEINSIDQDMIILSSYEHRELLKNESLQYPKGIKIFDMYQFLEERGYPIKGIYCDLIGMAGEGYSVGYPF